MPESTALTPYRPGQGTYARSAAAAAMAAVSLFGCWQLRASLEAGQWGARTAFPVLGLNVKWSVLVAGGLFVVLGFLIFMLTFGLQTGLQWVDGKTHVLIDMLIDTEAELTKVAWPDKEQLTRYSVAVLLFIALFGIYLLSVDYLVAFLMRLLGVLPKG